MPDPVHVTIGDHNWKIVWVDKLQQNGESCYGWTCTGTKTITLINGQSREELLDTILHEACHVAEDGTTFLAESWIAELTSAQVKLLAALKFISLSEDE
jgi:hypothetical protein